MFVMQIYTLFIDTLFLSTFHKLIFSAKLTQNYHAVIVIVLHYRDITLYTNSFVLNTVTFVLPGAGFT